MKHGAEEGGSPVSKPYLSLNCARDVIEGDRDALVTLRSAINEALRKGSAMADVSDERGDDLVLVVKRHGE